MATRQLYLYPSYGGNPIVFTVDATAALAVGSSIRDSWQTGQAYAIKNPAAEQYVNSLHVVSYIVS